MNLGKAPKPLAFSFLFWQWGMLTWLSQRSHPALCPNKHVELQTNSHLILFLKLAASSDFAGHWPTKPYRPLKTNSVADIGHLAQFLGISFGPPFIYFHSNKKGGIIQVSPRLHPPRTSILAHQNNKRKGHLFTLGHLSFLLSFVFPLLNYKTSEE